MPRILLIDDDEALGEPLAAYFARFGFELVQANRVLPVAAGTTIRASTTRT